MYRFKKILVNLSLTHGDTSVLRFASLVAKLSRAESVTFLYSREPVEVPESLQKQYPWLVQPIQEAAGERARDAVEKGFAGESETNVSVELEEQDPSLALLERCVSQDIDLVITGECESDPWLVTKLARKAPCSVLLVPAESSGHYSKIAAGVDFSRYSKYVMDVSSSFAVARDLPSVDAITMYEIPPGLHKASIPRDEFVQDLRSHAKGRLEEFLGKCDLKGIEPNLRVLESAVPGLRLLSLCEEDGYDLLVIGCRGKSALTAALVGSNAEDVLREAKSTAVLAVKEKGTGRGFLESLLGSSSSRGEEI